MTRKTRMTEAEAIERARRVAEAEGWPWEEQISAMTRKKGLFSNSLYWQVISNRPMRGRNAIICIDDETGEVLTKGFQRR
jgi:hypothetical protein